MANKFAIEINDVARGVICYDLIDTSTGNLVGEYMESDGTLPIRYPMAPSGHQNAIVAAHAWELLQALRCEIENGERTAEYPPLSGTISVLKDVLAALKALGYE